MTNGNFCGVILAGGKGTRMGALTRVTNKHLLPVGDVPMIYHPLRKLVRAGVRDIMIVSGTEHMGDFVSLLGSGSGHACNLTYRVQDEAGGIAQALGLAEGFCCGNGHPVVLLGDNIFEDSLVDLLQDMEGVEQAAILLKKVHDPQRYGVAELGRRLTKTCPDGQACCMVAHHESYVVRIVEKPIEPYSDLAVTGVYVYPHDVFDVIRTLRPSERGELEITDVNNYYVQQNRMQHHMLNGYWTDAGTLDSLAEANRLVREARPE